MRRWITAALIASGVAAGAVLPVEAAAGLRVRDRLTWSQPDGTPVTFPRDVSVWCGRWERDVKVPSIHVRVGSRTAPRWELNAVVADIRRRPVVRLPHAFSFDRPTGAQFFATDGRNELNSDTDESSGRIRFQRVGCGKRLRIAFTFNGRVGSEFGDGDPLTVRGSFSASR